MFIATSDRLLAKPVDSYVIDRLVQIRTQVTDRRRIVQPEYSYIGFLYGVIRSMQ
jgi:hypothetical protein